MSAGLDQKGAARKGGPSIDMTQGPAVGSMLRFALPMILGNLLQQCYNIADTLIVGRFLGANALAAVGSSFTLMTFLTSILLGLCMGSGTLWSIRFGQRDRPALRESILAAFALIASLTVALNLLAFICLDGLRVFLQVPGEVWGDMREYLAVIFAGIAATFLYNFFASLLRAVGDSVTPLIFLAVSAVLNIGLDLWFVVGLHWGVAGAAGATVIAQYVSGAGIAAYSLLRLDMLRYKRRELRGIGGICRRRMREIAGFSVLTCVQQSVMNLGILLVQGVVNSFGPAVMAAFAAGVKIDAFAYMPVQDFGNAFSTFIAQNYGAEKPDRIRAGFRGAVVSAVVFCVAVSGLVWVFARPLMLLFIDPAETAILAEGVRYLHIEGAFYIGIGCLFLLYGLYRGLGRPGMSVVLTVASLGTRVALAYLLPALGTGVAGVWWSVPIGWALADIIGFAYYLKKRKHLTSPAKLKKDQAQARRGDLPIQPDVQAPKKPKIFDALNGFPVPIRIVSETAQAANTSWRDIIMKNAKRFIASLMAAAILSTCSVTAMAHGPHHSLAVSGICQGLQVGCARFGHAHRSWTEAKAAAQAAMQAESQAEAPADVPLADAPEASAPEQPAAPAAPVECGWVDNDCDGVCDNYGSEYCHHAGPVHEQCGWVDNDGDGICDNYGSEYCHHAGWTDSGSDDTSYGYGCGSGNGGHHGGGHHGRHH